MTTQEFINKWTLLFADTPDKNITAEKMRDFTSDAGSLIIESFTNIKTIEGQSLLGIGNIDLSKTDAGLSNVDNTSDINKPISTLTQIALNAKQTALVSGTNIKTLEGQSLLGSGNIDITKTDVGLSNVDNTSDINKPISTLTQIALNAKQATLANGTNIKTVNGNSLLGSGNLALNFIPLTGTEVGKPITGDIEFDASNGTNRSLKYSNFNDDLLSFIEFTNENIQIIGSNFNGSLITGLSFNKNNVLVFSNVLSSRGIASQTDFTPNITELDYTQKKYVDEKFNNALSIPFILTEVSTNDNIINLQENTVYIKKYFINDAYMNTAASFNNINIILLYATTNIPVPGEEFEVYFYSSVNILLDFKYDVNGEFTITDKFSIESGKSYKLSVCMMPLRANPIGKLFPHATLDQVGLSTQISFNTNGLVFDFDFEQTNKMTVSGAQKLTSYIDRGIILESNYLLTMKPVVTPDGLYFDGIDDVMAFQNPLYYTAQEIWIVCNNNRLTVPNDVLFNDDYSNNIRLVNTNLMGGTQTAINNIVSNIFTPNNMYKSISTLLNPGLEQMFIGGSININPSYWMGYIKRILIFDTPRTGPQRTALQAYLAQKYSL